MSEEFFKNEFTFQYGSIQIDLALEYVDRYVNLHSNMVLFKSHLIRHGMDLESIYIPIWFYSNSHYSAYRE